MPYGKLQFLPFYDKAKDMTFIKYRRQQTQDEWQNLLDENGNPIAFFSRSKAIIWLYDYMRERGYTIDEL
jgi:hypothetical protein